MKVSIEHHPFFGNKHRLMLEIIKADLDCEIEFLCEYKTEHFDNILLVVLAEFNLTKEQIFSSTRKMLIVSARQTLIYLCKKYMHLNDRELSEVVKKDRTTIIYSVSRIQDLIDTNDDIKWSVENCIDKINKQINGK